MRTGVLVPSLELPATTGGTLLVNQAPTGRRYLVLYAYPRIGRPDQAPLSPDWERIPGAMGCTAEACSFRDVDQELADAGADVIGVSTQDTEYQQEAVRRLHLPFPMVSDENRELAEALGLPQFEVAGHVLLRRVTLVVEDRRIVKVFDPVTDPAAHPQEVLAWLRSVAD